MALDPPGGSPRPKWSLSQDAFEGLLTALGPDRDAAAVRYLEVRRNLVRFFEWRACPTPEEFADEALNRCARKIEDGEPIRDVSGYAIGVARMMLREMGRTKETRSLDDVPEPRTLPIEPDQGSDRRVECLRHCLQQLSPENRDLILHYYQGDKGEKIRNRKGLGALFGVSAGLLRMRALRLRERLHTCVEDCVRKSQGNSL